MEEKDPSPSFFFLSFIHHSSTTFPKLAYCMLLVDNALILADSEEEESEFC